MRNSTHPGKVHLELPRLKCSSLYNLCYLCHHLLGPMGTGCRLRDLRRRAVACPVQLPGKRAPQAERGDGCGPVPLETLGDFELTKVEVGSCEFSEFLDVSVSEVPFDDLDWFTASRRPRFRGSAENPFFKDFNDLLPASKATSPGSQGSLFSAPLLTAPTPLLSTRSLRPVRVMTKIRLRRASISAEISLTVCACCNDQRNSSAELMDSR